MKARVGERVAIQIELTQAEAEVLHRAIDEYFHSRIFMQTAEQMHEKVADALIAGGYDPMIESSRW